MLNYLKWIQRHDTLANTVVFTSLCILGMFLFFVGLFLTIAFPIIFVYASPLVILFVFYMIYISVDDYLKEIKK